MLLHTSADKDWKVEILLVLYSVFALALRIAKDSEEKWNILSLSGGASNLVIN